jgi:esterase/lipase
LFVETRHATSLPRTTTPSAFNNQYQFNINEYHHLKNKVMKKILLLLVAPFIFFTAQSKTITPEEADGIVLDRLSQETQQYTVYAKDGVQQKMTVTTANGEVIEVNYKFWIYYVDYINDC